MNILGTRSIWLFIDALDESGEKDAKGLVNEFKSLIKTLPPTRHSLRICFSCRPYPILYLDTTFNEICLEQENADAIATYVNDRLSDFSWRTSSTIPKLIVDRANGIFLWALLVVNRVLDHELKGAELTMIEAEIRSIPPELNTLYHELARGMTSASLKLIQWICFATQPLSLHELRWAMIVDADCPHKSLQRCRDNSNYIRDNDVMERKLKTLSCGLAEAVSSSKKKLVQFIHQSVKDFFVEGGLSTLDRSPGIRLSTGLSLHPMSDKTAENKLAAGIAHYQLSRICIRYLAMAEIDQAKMNKCNNMMIEFPLLYYATTSWISHVYESEMKNVSQDDLLDCFAWSSETLLQIWVQVYNILAPYSRHCPSFGTNMAHIASRYQLIGPLRIILQRTNQVNVDMNSEDGEGYTPLLWAAEEGHDAVVKLLMETGQVNIESKNYFNQTPLSLAAENGYKAVVKLLLETGQVNINSKDNYNRTPLSWAARNRHEAVVKLLLETGQVNFESKDNFDRTPLSLAAENGHEAVVKLLLETGQVNINSKDNFDRTPLLWAAEYGHEAVVKLLLETGQVNIESKDKDNQTPLLWAARNGHEAVVKLLLETGQVNVNTKDEYNQTPLSWAAENGHEAVVKLLKQRMR